MLLRLQQIRFHDKVLVVYINICNKPKVVKVRLAIIYKIRSEHWLCFVLLTTIIVMPRTTVIL